MQKVRHFCIQIFNGLSSQNDILNIFGYIKKSLKTYYSQTNLVLFCNLTTYFIMLVRYIMALYR